MSHHATTGNERVILFYRAFVSVSLGLFFCLGLVNSVAVAAGQGRIVVTGSSTIAPLLSDIARRYEVLNPGLEVDVQTGGSSRGIADVRKDTADIGMVSRDLTTEETDLTGYVLARDGIALIVHASNPVRSLTDDDVLAIFTRRKTRWSDFGGPDRPITLLNKAEGRSTLDVFLAYLRLNVRDIKPDVVIGDNEQAVKVLAGNPNAIGYVSIGTIEYHLSAGTPIRALALGPVAPSSQAVAEGRYAASRRLNLVVKGAPSPEVARFLDYCQGADVHDLIRDHAFVAIPR